jgi:hypothetical protein
VEERTSSSNKKVDNLGVKRRNFFHLFDTILEHLVSEGYADTNESALAIMANMSEEWRQSIVETGYYSSCGRCF